MIAQDWVYFFPAVSVFLLVAFFFARVFVKRIEGRGYCGEYIFDTDVHNGSC